MSPASMTVRSTSIGKRPEQGTTRMAPWTKQTITCSTPGQVTYPPRPSLITEPIQKTDPEYTEEARLAELEGTVVLLGMIGQDGLAHDLSVEEPLGLGLDEKAIQAAAQWHFQPADLEAPNPS